MVSIQMNLMSAILQMPFIMISTLKVDHKPFQSTTEVLKRELENLCPSPSTPATDTVPHSSSDSKQVVEPVVDDSQWRLGVVANHTQFAGPPAPLLLPWGK